MILAIKSKILALFDKLSQRKVVLFEYVDFWPKILFFRTQTALISKVIKIEFLEKIPLQISKFEKIWKICWMNF